MRQAVGAQVACTDQWTFGTTFDLRANVCTTRGPSSLVSGQCAATIYVDS